MKVKVRLKQKVNLRPLPSSSSPKGSRHTYDSHSYGLARRAPSHALTIAVYIEVIQFDCEDEAQLLGDTTLNMPK